MQTSQAVQVPNPMKSIASPSGRPHLRDVSWSATGCAGCARRAQCLPAGLSDTELLQLHDIVGNRRRVKRGEILWETGDSLHALYAVRLGFLKSFIITGDGQVQVSSILFGIKSFERGKVIGIILRDTVEAPKAAQYVIKTKTGSKLQAQSVDVKEDSILIKNPLLAEYKVPMADLLEIEAGPR